MHLESLRKRRAVLVEQTPDRLSDYLRIVRERELRWIEAEIARQERLQQNAATLSSAR